VAATRHSDIPDDVMALVRTVPAWADADVDVSELHGGITNRNYRIDVGGGSYVIRLPGERTELLGIDRVGEVEAARRAASLGIGPAVFGVLPGTGTVITDFVPGWRSPRRVRCCRPVASKPSLTPSLRSIAARRSVPPFRSSGSSNATPSMLLRMVPSFPMVTAGWRR